MKQHKLLTLILLFVSSIAFANDLPNFDDYPSKTIYKGALTSINFANNPKASMFKTRLN